MELTSVYLENAGKTQDPDIALVLCHDTEASLFQSKKAAQGKAVRRGLHRTRQSVRQPRIPQ